MRNLQECTPLGHIHSHRWDKDHTFVSEVKSVVKVVLTFAFIHILQAAIEIPYVFIQVLLYTLIVYPSIGYYWTAHKLLWFFYTSFCSVLSYVYVGLLLVSLTPNVEVATILASLFNNTQSLFSGFVLPAPVSQNFLPTSYIPTNIYRQKSNPNVGPLVSSTPM